ncbi:hypothetical protein VP01_174g5 [Puccinia sorghi]|uniref:Ysc84 actin-binding domain-containing protein n=1 Tax=Puccinia sorghi TaxID=27349 RepID=A0A0L6VF65_9BASI|nr:hypothetical protein VP01_174g5 [Puccinia sorghi]
MSSPTKPRPQSAYQLTQPHHPLSPDDHDGELELRRQQALKAKLSGTPKTSLDWAGNIGIEPTSLDKECDKCARILYTFTQRGVDGTIHSTLEEPQAERKTQRVLKKIPTHIIQQAEGLAIFTVFRSDLGTSAASGSGVVISRDSPTTWGAPSGILIHTMGFGLLAGIDLYDAVLVLRTQKAVMSFAKPKISLGAELAVVAGPIGNGVSFESGPEITPVFSYTKSKGIYGGLQLDGNIIVERTEENARFYGRKVKAEQILQGGAVAVPRAASGLIAVIDAAEGKAYDADDFPESIDVAPSEESNGVSTVRESRAKAAQECGLDPVAEDEALIEPPTWEDLSHRRRTMPPMALHSPFGSPSKAKQEPQPDEAKEEEAEQPPTAPAEKETDPMMALASAKLLSPGPPPPPPRRRGVTVSRPPPADPPLPLTSSKDRKEPSPSIPDLDPLSTAVPLLSSSSSDKPPEPFLLHERSDSAEGSVSASYVRDEIADLSGLSGTWR